MNKKEVCTTSELCQFEGISCMGCCGHTYTGKKEVSEGIHKNTEELHEFIKKGKTLSEYRDRLKTLRHCGVCRNLINKNEKIFCPLHPAQAGKDLRIGHCDRNYLCQTAKEFNTWDKSKQNEFKQFLRNKKLDWYDYSMGMDGGKLLKEFETSLD